MKVKKKGEKKRKKLIEKRAKKREIVEISDESDATTVSDEIFLKIDYFTWVYFSCIPHNWEISQKLNSMCKRIYLR